MQSKVPVIMGSIGVMIIIWWIIVTFELVVPGAPPLGKKKKFKTGDLVFFSGSSWTEKTIKTATGSRYNHVGMIVAARETEGSSTQYYVMESDITPGYRKGPRLVPWEYKLKTWKGDQSYGYRPIKRALDEQNALRFISSRADVGFDSKMWSFMFPGTKWKEITKTPDYFCSEFIAEFLMQEGIVAKGDPSDYSPQMLWNLKDPYGPHQTIPFD